MPYDPELLSLVAAGNEQAFTQVFMPLLSPMEASIMRLVKNKAITQDILQETLLKCWQNKDKLEHVIDLKAYVYTIAVNEFHQFLRKEAAEHRRRKILEQKGVVSLTEGGMRLMEIREALLHAVDELSPQRQKVYWLSREEQLTIPEIADKLRLSSSTVKHTLMAALNGIREYLEKAGFTPFF